MKPLYNFKIYLLQEVSQCIVPTLVQSNSFHADEQTDDNFEDTNSLIPQLCTSFKNGIYIS